MVIYKNIKGSNCFGEEVAEKAFQKARGFVPMKHLLLSLIFACKEIVKIFKHFDLVVYTYICS